MFEQALTWLFLGMLLGLLLNNFHKALAQVLSERTLNPMPAAAITTNPYLSYSDQTAASAGKAMAMR